MQPYDTFNFSGAKATYATIGASAIANVGLTGPSCENIVDITATAHGFLAGPTLWNFNCVYVLGVTGYSGLKRILSVPDVNSIYIFNAYTAKTPAGTETLRTAITYPTPFEFLGWELHLSAVPTTSENLVIAKDANRGSAYDTVIRSIDLSTLSVPDSVNRFNLNEGIPCEKDDVIDITWLNTDTKTWIIKLFARSLV